MLRPFVFRAVYHSWFTALAVMLLTLLSGCKHDTATDVAYKPEPIDPWVLTCTNPADPTPAYLSNGLIGLRVARNGSGENLPMFDIDEYDTTGEEKIRPLPSVLAWKLPFDPATISDYWQALDMRTGMLTTRWKQAGKSITIETVMDPTSRIVSQRFSGEAAPQTHSQPYPDGTPVNDYFTSDEHTWQITPPRGHRAMVAAMGKTFEPPTLKEAETTFAGVAKRAAEFWAKQWKTDIEIDGPARDQQAVRSFLFYLKSSMQPGQLMTISPFALSSERYNGHVFWDADIWVFPALALLDPQRAKSIPEYRFERQAAGVENFKIWERAHRPTATGRVKRNALSGELSAGVKFPWESSVTGHETATGPTQFEDHITGDVCWSANQAAALQLISEPAAQLTRMLSESFWVDRLDGEDVRGVVSPDENFTGDNDLYTNLLAKWCLADRDLAKQIKIPHDDQSLLTYDGDQLKGYKQAAAVLAIYPLQNPEAEKQARVMMERFADKVVKNGPAMSDSLHALIWARLGESDKAYSTWQKSWQDFTQTPLMLFSEKRSRPTTYFTTGAAGCLQTVLYGFLGFRIDSKKDPKAAWTKQLKAGQWLSVTPHLPKAWRSVKLKNFEVLGTRYTLTATPSGVQVTPGD